MILLMEKEKGLFKLVLNNIFFRMQEINKRLAAYSINEKIEKIPNILDVNVSGVTF